MQDNYQNVGLTYSSLLGYATPHVRAYISYVNEQVVNRRSKLNSLYPTRECHKT